MTPDLSGNREWAEELEKYKKRGGYRSRAIETNETLDFGKLNVYDAGRLSLTAGGLFPVPLRGLWSSKALAVVRLYGLFRRHI